MRLFVALLVALFYFIDTTRATSTRLECHQGTFSIKKNGTEVTQCTSSKAKSCQIVFNKSKQTVVQSCVTSYCSPNSKVEPVSVCRLTTTGLTCCCHGYGCNKRQLITVLPPSYWKKP